MPQYEFLRGIIGVIGLACAYMTGRAVVMFRKGWYKIGKLYGWILRSVVCLIAVMFRHPVDTVAIGVWVAAAVLFGVGFWNASHIKPPEDLTHEIFPE